MDIFISLCLATILLRLAWIDQSSHKLPDRLTLPLIAAGLALSFIGREPPFWLSVLGGVIGYGLFWGIGTLYFQRHGREGLGLGDAKLFAAAGTWVGASLLPHVLLIACVAGLLQTIIKRRAVTDGIAFGPWLALGFWLVWVASEVGMVVPALSR